MDIEKDWKEELGAFGKRLKARKAAEKYAPWHPRNVLLHPTRTWRLAFGIVGDDEMEKALAHMDSGTAGVRATEAHPRQAMGPITNTTSQYLTVPIPACQRR